MNNINPIEPIPAFAITAADPRMPLPVGGEFVHCLSADEDFELSVNRGSSSVPMATNRTFRMPPGERFSHIEARRKDGATIPANNVRLIVGAGDYKDGALALTAPVSVASPGSLVDAGDMAVPSGVATQILPALSSRREAIVSNVSPIAFRIGGANTVGAARGIPLAAGQTVILEVSGELWAYQNSGAAQNIAANYTA